MKNLNKKGFTLIELLAVIAILAILMLMVTPNILSMFTSGRRQAFVTKVQTVWRAAEQGYMNDVFSNSQKSLYCSSTLTGKPSTCGPISIITETDAIYYVSMADGYVTDIVVSDSNFCYAGSNINVNKDTDLQEGKVAKCTTSTGENPTTTCTCADA